MKNMNTSKRKTIIAPRSEDYSKWYIDVINNADLAENSPVRGCMIIKPNGYAIWENIRKTLDDMFKLRGIQNAYFPLLIPKRFFEKEAKHVEGFAKECAVVTHHRLRLDENKKLIPSGLLEEPLVIRPTSETIIYSMYAKWIHSFRDLPIKMNQWANVIRWELRTRPFLRTTEFLWQEGHTAHSSREEAENMTTEMLEVYRKFVEEYLAIPVIPGIKSETEKFAGAVYTASLEALIQDGKALQIATSHMQGQNFAKPFNVKFIDKNETEQYVWQTSWGISTRVIGALIMTHSDDKGLIIPPKIAPMPIVVIPIWRKDSEKNKIINEAKKIALEISSKTKYDVHIDEKDERPGPKFYNWERKGVPLRIEIGPQEITDNAAIMVRRDTGKKTIASLSKIASEVNDLLDDIQSNLYNQAIQRKEKATQKISSYNDMKKIFRSNKDGFICAGWCGELKCETKVKEDTKATIRCIHLNQEKEKGKCIICNKETLQKVIFAKAY